MLEYIQDPVSGMDGLRPFLGNASKITIHRTQTEVKPNWQVQRKGLPHFTLDGNKVYVHLPLDMAAYTMGGGDSSPNSDAGTHIQIEWVGYSENTKDESDESYAALAELIDNISQETGCPWLFPFPFAGQGVDVRQPWTRYEIASGIMGHGHAPWNTHWDPGILNIGRLLEHRPEPLYLVDLAELEKLIVENAGTEVILAAISRLETTITNAGVSFDSSLVVLNDMFNSRFDKLEQQINLVSEFMKNMRLVVE
jgi:hypothetical protein